MKVILVDDEKSMLLIMKKMISKIPEMEVMECFQSTREAYKFLKCNKVDIAFVDINMPEESGLAFSRRILSEFAGLEVIFLTGHKEFAHEAFDMNASDYIVKPISQTRLENSIQRVKKRHIFLKPAQEEEDCRKIFIYCLGTMEARCTDGCTLQFISSKSVELLAYLLLKRGKSVSKWRIIEDIFHEMPLQNAETYLNTTVYKLRKTLENCGMKSALISANEGYRIDTKSMYVDFIDFENRIIQQYNYDNSNLEEALKTERLYAGELFGEKDYYWSLSEKEKFTQIYRSFAKKVVGCLLERNHLTEALYVLKKLEDINELEEEMHCLLMKVYAAQGDKISLQKQFEKYSKILQRELGIAPEKAVTDVYMTLKNSLG